MLDITDENLLDEYEIYCSEIMSYTYRSRAQLPHHVYCARWLNLAC